MSLATVWPHNSTERQSFYRSIGDFHAPGAMPFPTTNPISPRRSPDLRSSPAASGNFSGFGSDSSYDLIQSPTLQFTPSNNGSDRSEDSSWVKSDFENETRDSPSTSASIPRPQQIPRVELLNQNQPNTSGHLALLPPENIHQDPTDWIRPILQIPGHTHHTSLDPVTNLDSNTLITYPGSPLWSDSALNNYRTPSEGNAFGHLSEIDADGMVTTSEITHRDSSINTQSDNAFYLNLDESWWPKYCLENSSAQRDQQPLLGIPQNLPRFSEGPVRIRDLAKRTQGYNSISTGNFYLGTGMTPSTHVNPPTTLRTSSTSSSRDMHFNSRDTNRASILGVVGSESKSLKRSIEYDYTNPNCITSSNSSSERVAKKAKHRTLPHGTVASLDNVTNTKSNPQPRVVPFSTTTELMDERLTLAWDGSTPIEAEEPFSPLNISAEFPGLYLQTQQDYQDEILGPIHSAMVRIIPPASDPAFCSPPFVNPIITPIPPESTVPISPEIPDMDLNNEDYYGVNNFNHDSPGHISSISTVPVSPCVSESPGPQPFGPSRPPGHSLPVQISAFPRSNYGYFVDPGTQDFNQLQSNSGWPPQDQIGFPSGYICDQYIQSGNIRPEEEDDQADDEDHSHRAGAAAPARKRRGPFDPNRRGVVEQVRKAGACLRCHYLRESCDLGNPCSNCKKVDGKQKIWASLPCTRFKITEAYLFRKGNSKFKQPEAEYITVRDQFLPNSELKSVFLGRPPPITSKYWPQGRNFPKLKIKCREFKPKDGDLVEETWNEDGREINYRIPPFAAYDQADTSEALRSYVRETFDLFKYDMVSEEHDPLVQLVFKEAIRYSDQHQCTNEGKPGPQEACMLKDALKIWIVTRLCYEGYGILEGGEHFGVEMINNPKSPYHETVPISPILDNQLDTIGIKYMEKLKANVLKSLKARIAKRRKSQWYEIFLTIFVLLHNLEYVAMRQYQYMKRHENTRASGGVEFFTTTWMTEWEYAANMLIKHFQIALKGAVPFSFNWEGSGEPKNKTKGKRKATNDPVEEAKNKAGMDDAAVNFMKGVCLILRDRESEFRNLENQSNRREYSKDMVWVSQLFLDV